jgi:hypothetical protein
VPSVADPLDADALKRAFVETYESQQYADPWDAIEQYETVLDAVGKHPERKSAAISSIVDLPRERIRPWVDGDGMPDQYRGLQTLQDRGWLPEDWDDDTMGGLNALVAAIFAGGSIRSDSYSVRFTVSDADERAIVEGAGRLLDVRLDEVASDPIELRPVGDNAVLGRLLAALGAPIGDKNPESVESLPAYLGSAPLPLRRDFARIYVQFRATETPREGMIQLQEQRSEAFYETLVGLLRDVTIPSDIGGSTFPSRITGEAQFDLQRLPTFATTPNS